MRWTQDQLAAYQQRRHPAAPTEADEGLESSLQKRIEDYCEDRGFYLFHDRSRKANRPGHPDLTVALPGGRVLWLELKSKHGRLSSEQEQVRLRLLAMGQEWHEVRSFRQFLSLVEPLPAGRSS